MLQPRCQRLEPRPGYLGRFDRDELMARKMGALCRHHASNSMMWQWWHVDVLHEDVCERIDIMSHHEPPWPCHAVSLQSYGTMQVAHVRCAHLDLDAGTTGLRLNMVCASELQIRYSWLGFDEAPLQTCRITDMWGCVCSYNSNRGTAIETNGFQHLIGDFPVQTPTVDVLSLLPRCCRE